MAKPIDVKVPDIGDFERRADHRGDGQAGRLGEGRGPTDHSGIRQGFNGDSGAEKRSHQGDQSKGWRQGEGRHADPHA